MAKIVFIGAGSGFGAKTVVDLLSFEELRDSEICLVDINPNHLGPVVEYSRKVADHYGAPTRITEATQWAGGVLEGADYVITAFAAGGPAYRGPLFQSDVCLPQEYGIYQNVADTVGLGGVLRTMRTAPELLALAAAMRQVCPHAVLINYVNPMSMLMRTLQVGEPEVASVGLCHNVQGGIRWLERALGLDHKQLRFQAAGVNHMDWFLRVEYLDGRDAYPDLRDGEKAGLLKETFPVQWELLQHVGYWTTESSGHCAEYLPYFMPRQADREALGLKVRDRPGDADPTAPRWAEDSDLMKQLRGETELTLTRTPEYGAHIVWAMETDNVCRIHGNVLNAGCLENFPDDYCVEVCCTVDRTGIHPQHAGRMPTVLAALCRGMADMETLASEAVLERDLTKAYHACLIDPMTAASATPATIRECFNRLLDAQRDVLTPYWGEALSV